MTRLLRAAVGLSAMLTAACAVGPAYVRPVAPAAPVDSFKEAGGWKQSQPADESRRGSWWEIFGDERLNALEQAMSTSNQDLKAADARFREARALIGVSRAAQSPAVATAPGAAFLRTSGNVGAPSSQATGIYPVPVDLSYEVDLWGRIRQTVAAAREQAQA